MKTKRQLIKIALPYVLLSLLLSGCGGVGMAVVGTSLGLAGTRGLEYYDTGETTSIIYTDPDTIERSIVYAFDKFDYKLESKYLLSNGIIGYTGHDNNPIPENVVEIEIELDKLATNITEITITAREDNILPEEGVCHILMNEIAEHTGAQKQQQNG